MHVISPFFAILFVAFLLVVTVRGQASKRLPLSEYLVLRVFRLAAWLEHVATAWDAAIVRYRMERLAAVIELQSTAERLGRRAA